jgi:hypothetical protein
MEEKMRYILETIKDDGNVGRKIEQWRKDGIVEIVDKGKLEEIMSDRVKIIKNALLALKSAGFSSAVIEAYIYSTTGISKKTISDVLDAQEGFFRQIGIKI